MNIKIGACEWALPGNGIGSLKLARDMGIKGLQLGFGFHEKGYRLSQKWFRDYYLEEAGKYDIELLSIAVCEFDIYGLSNPKNSEKGRIAYDIINLAIEAAADMHMKMVMAPSFVDGFMNSDEEIYNTAVALKYACRLAKEHGICIANENILTIEKIDLLFKEVDEPNFWMFYDSQNYVSNVGWDQVSMLEQIYDRLYPQIHVKDGVGQANSSRLLGQGDTNFYGTIEFLKKKDYSGWLLLENFYECMPLRALSPYNYMDIMKMDIDTIRKACGIDR